HLAILDFLNVSRAAVALTKIDRCDDSRVSTVKQEVENLISHTMLVDSPVFEISNTEGTGIAELKSHLCSMIVEETEQLDDSASKRYGEHFRFLVDRSFSVKGIGTVVTGTVRSGSAAKESEFIHSATSAKCKIRGIRLDENDLETAEKGTRVALNINIDHKQLSRGDWILAEAIFNPVNRIDARLNLTDSEGKLRSNAQYHLFLGASHHVVTIRKLSKDDENIYQIKCHEPMNTLYGDRFIIRDPASQDTIGGGEVIDIFVPRKSRSSEMRLRVLQAMDQNPLDALTSLVELQPNGVDLENFTLSRNLMSSALENLVLKLKNIGIQFVELNLQDRSQSILLHQNFYHQYCQEILTQIEVFHSQFSNQQGISEPALSRAVGFSGPHKLFHSLLTRLQTEHSVKQTGTLLHLPGHAISLSKEETDFLEKIRPILLKAGNVAPRTRELVESTGIPLSALDRILRQSAKAGTLIKVADNRYYLPETIMSLAEFTEKLAAEQNDEDGFSVIGFRDESGIGRNLCIEILEYFDSIGFTRRDGNIRFLRTEKENVFGK
ncbi:MAG: selenocysteine-specific translation elongation factor, partial [Gammaproteobacteria bacterium]|nr:selenocysteine-specific translation elongation factor [Gammaproteobacteria bacterium]